MEQSGNQTNFPIIVRVLILSLPLVLVLCVSEWLAGRYLKYTYGEQFDIKVQGVGEMAPSRYQLWKHPSNYSNLLQISRYNNLGFRRMTDTPIQKPEGVTRVVLLGGSGALGSGATRLYPWYEMSGQAQYSADETISAYLETLLNEKFSHKKFEVLNAATNWSQLHQQLIHYYRKIRYIDADLVISMDGQNDAIQIKDRFMSLWDQSEFEKVESLESNFKVKMRPFITRSYLLYLVAAKAFGSNLSGRQANNSTLVDKFKALGRPNNYEQRIGDYYLANQDLVDRGVRNYIDHLKHFNDALERDGVKALFLLQPELVMDTTKPLTDIETALQNYLFINSKGYPENFFRLIEHQGRLQKQEESLPFVSFLNIFDDVKEEVYVDYTHLTPRGNELLATELMREIENHYPLLLK